LYEAVTAGFRQLSNVRPYETLAGALESRRGGALIVLQPVSLCTTDPYTAHYSKVSALCTPITTRLSPMRLCCGACQGTPCMSTRFASLPGTQVYELAKHKLASIPCGNPLFLRNQSTISAITDNRLAAYAVPPSPLAQGC
jgi:hypothetical protein